MRSSQHSEEALLAFMESVLRSGATPTAVPPLVDAEAARVVCDLRVLAESIPVPVKLSQKQEAPPLRDAGGLMPSAPTAVRHRWQEWGNHWLWRWSTSRLGHVATTALLILLLGIGLLMTSSVWAQLGPLTCLVPQLGGQACGVGALVAAQPASVSRDGRTLTVTQLLSANGRTLLKLEISPQPDGGITLRSTPGSGSGPMSPVYGGGVPILVAPGAPPVSRASAVPSTPPVPVNITLEDSTDKVYPRVADLPQPVGVGSRFLAGVGTPRVAVINEVFAQLDPGVRSVTVRLSAPDPLGSWSVSVALASLHTSGQEGLAVTHQGITLGATLVANPQQTIVHLVAMSQAPGVQIHDIGGELWLGQRLVLQDDQGRSYAESPPTPGGPAPADCFGSARTLTLSCNTYDAVFPPLPPDVHAVALTVPFMTVAEENSSASLPIPVGGKTPGDQIPIHTDMKLASYHLRVMGADLVNILGHRAVTLHVDRGDWQNGRKLLGAGTVTVEGINGGGGGGESLDRTADIRVGLPDGASDHPVVTFHSPLVAVNGPWKLQLPISTGGN